MRCHCTLSTCSHGQAELVIRVFPTGEQRPVTRACARKLEALGLFFTVDETSWMARGVARGLPSKVAWP